MSYTKDAREMVLSYLAKGHTYEEAHDELGVSISSIKEWKKLLNTTGSLEQRPRERSTSKFHSDELKTYVTEHPDVTLEEIARHFGGFNIWRFRCSGTS